MSDDVGFIVKMNMHSLVMIKSSTLYLLLIGQLFVQDHTGQYPVT